MLESEHGDILVASPCETYEEDYLIEPIEEYYGEEHCDNGGTVKIADLIDEIKSGKYQIVEEVKGNKE